MGRVGNLINAAGRSAGTLGPLDVLFAGVDYYDGKQSGEDDIRATAGAAGSTVGGWGGALAGAAAGSAILPGIGTAIGGIIGGMGGSFLGGWGADRADELVRGDKGLKKDKNMATFYNQQQYYDPNQGNQFEDLTNLAGAGLLGTAGVGYTKAAMQPGTFTPGFYYENARNIGKSRPGAVASAARNTLDDGLRLLKNLPGWAKVAGAVGTGLLANNMLGNPLGKTIDTVTGQTTNLDNDSVNRQRKEAEKQLRYQQEVGQARSNAELERLYQDPSGRFIDDQTQRTLAQQRKDFYDQIEYADELQKQWAARNLVAANAYKLMENWNKSAQNVNSMMHTVTNARYG